MRTGLKTTAKTRLGAAAQRLLAYAQWRKMTLIRPGDVRAILGITAVQERRLFARLARGGTILRLQRGLYLVPPRLPLGGVWSPGETVVLRDLMRALDNGQYQLCGWPVFQRYGFTEQVSAQIYAYNNRIYGRRAIGGREYVFIKVPDRRLGGTVRSTAGGEGEILPTCARALVDAVYDWARFGTLPKALNWIRESVAQQPALAGELVKAALQFGNQGTLRRIGHVLERQGRLSAPARRSLQKALRSRRSIIPLVPGRPVVGTCSRDWGVVDNE